MAGQQPLELLIEVRILAGQQNSNEILLHKRDYINI